MVRFAKYESHEAKEVAMHITFLYGIFDFCEDFTLCEIVEVHVILKVIFLKYIW